MKRFVVIVLSIWFVKASDIISDLKFLPDELIQTINSNGTTWKAGKNFEGVSYSEVKKLFMSSEESLSEIDKKVINHDADINVKYSNFDARIEWPKCKSIGQIFDQGLCSPSWIYAAVGQMADRICIKTGQNIDVKATVENMMKGNYDCNSSYNSADIGKAFQYWRENGIFIEKPEESSKQCHCRIKIDDEYFSVSYYDPKDQMGVKQEILTRGPMNLHINVYLDLLYYKSGVYQRTSNVKLGSHAVKVIGWGVENGVDYWLIANSWGTKWGDKGFFKLRRGFNEIGINDKSAAVKLEKNKAPSTMDKEQLFLVTHKCSCGCDRSW